MNSKTHDLLSIVNSKANGVKESFDAKSDSSFIFKLISFMEFNKWFDTKPELKYDESNQPHILFDEVEFKIINEPISQWFAVYGLNLESQNSKLFVFLKEKFNETAGMLNKYYSEIGIDLNHKIEMTEYLLYHLDTEIAEYSNDMLEIFVDNLCNILSLTMGMIICDFLAWCIENTTVKYSKKFKLNQRSFGRLTSSAYDGETYLQTIYYIFNPDYIVKNRTFERIAESSASADCFLYLSLHFICALRDSDLLRLPHPILDSDPSKILDSISKGTFSDIEAKNVVNSVLYQLQNLPYTPSKTSRYSDVPDIKFFVPTSCRTIIGIYFAAAEAHAQLKKWNGSRPLIRVITNPFDLGDAMGDDFYQLFLEENFRSRRANRAYMQAIELFADDNDAGITSPKGYILAALARSHKGSYGKFAETTEIYLKDAAFSGLTPEFVARELFEREVCSFIPSIFLKMVANEDYSKLSVTKQTLMIQQLGMSPGEIENLVTILEDAKNGAINIINEIIDIYPDRESLRKKIIEILHNIGCGSAASKQDNCLCLLIAMNNACSDVERKQCIGCKYEISTKSIIYLLTNEFKRLRVLMTSTEDKRLKNKYKAIISNVILPTMEEMLECIKKDYGNDSVVELEDIIRRYTE